MDSPNFEKVKQIIIEQLDVQADQVTEDASFIEDLGADSLDTVELVMALEENFDIDFLSSCEEAFITNSVIEVFPLTLVNGEKIGSGRPGLTTRRLQNAYMKLTTGFMGQL